MGNRRMTGGWQQSPADSARFEALVRGGAGTYALVSESARVAWSRLVPERVEPFLMSQSRASLADPKRIQRRQLRPKAARRSMGSTDLRVHSGSVPSSSHGSLVRREAKRRRTTQYFDMAAGDPQYFDMAACDLEVEDEHYLFPEMAKDCSKWTSCRSARSAANLSFRLEGAHRSKFALQCLGLQALGLAFSYFS